MQQNPIASFPADPVVIDVRSPQEYRAGHVQDALLMPLAELMEGRLPPVEDRSTPVVVYCCASGARSAQAEMILRHQGFTRVSNGVNAQGGGRRAGQTGSGRLSRLPVLPKAAACFNGSSGLLLRPGS